jgi:hypothetical protein
VLHQAVREIDQFTGCSRHFIISKLLDTLDDSQRKVQRIAAILRAERGVGRH